MEEFSFAKRQASWVKLVSSAAGGYLKIEVYYDECMKGKHKPMETFVSAMSFFYMPSLNSTLFVTSAFI